MAKKSKSKGNYELVENPVFDRDLEAGGAESSTSNVDHSTFVTGDETDLTQQSITVESSRLRNKFDEIATSPARRGFGFKTVKRNKKVFIFLGVFALIWLAVAIGYSTGTGSNVIDYYKSRIGSTGSGAAEVENSNGDKEQNKEQDEQESIPVYDDDDEELTEEAKNDRKPDSQKEEAKEGKQKDEEKAKGDSAKEEPKDAAKEEPKDAAKDAAKDKPKAVPSSNKPTGSTPISMADVRAGRFYVFNTAQKFIEPARSNLAVEDEGLYYFVDHESFKVEKVSDKSFRKSISSGLEIEYDGKKHRLAGFKPNFDLTYAIASTDVERIYRHSSDAYYWLYDIEKGTAEPLYLDSNEKISKLSLAEWSPNYKQISFVKDNNIYIKPLDGEAKQVTKDGTETIFNGKTDWVYEEEVLASDNAIWWSPDEKNIVFLKTDDSDVPKYNIDLFVQSKQGGATKYPITKQISYPKPGFSNPKVSLHVYNIASGELTEVDRKDSELGEEFVVYEVFFVDENSLIIKETDRESNILNIRYYNPQTKESKITFEVNAVEEYDGWIEKFNAPLLIPPSEDRPNWGFVDTIVVKGYNHLVYFETATTEKPKVLTEGDWEVLNSDLGFDKENNLVYFSANKRSSIDKHIYTVNLNNREINGFLGDSEQGYYDAHYSINVKYISLNYKGPAVPFQKLYRASDKKELALLSNPAILAMSEIKYAIPQKTYHRVQVDEFEDGSPVELNVIEILPKNFDKSKKHPLLVHFYAGPGSQVVTSKYDVDFEETVASSLDAVVLYIEPRGTAGQGWKFRSFANKKIGYWEPRDIVKVTQQWFKNEYIDQERTAVWGWSYGGFTTLKTLEYDAGETFKYGMAVAPVTNWLLYDSIYTERYMDKPENNKEGYEISQIKNVDNLKKASRFLIMHGTADDNVHIQNTYSLLDLLDLKGAANYDVHVFPDSEHSIYYHNANPVIYDKLSAWLKDAFEGDFDKLGHK